MKEKNKNKKTKYKPESDYKPNYGNTKLKKTYKNKVNSRKK